MLARAGYTDIQATGVTVVTDTQITCSINLAGAMYGPWNVTVTNPDTQSGTLTNGFTVTWSAYTVMYNGNGNSSGTVPFDPNPYYQGDVVMVLDNTGGLDRTGYAFNGWNTAADGSGTGYSPGAAFFMGSSSVTLYAQWGIHQYTLTYTAGADGSIAGTSPQTINHGSNGNTVTAVPNTGYHFVQWSDGMMTASRTDMNITGNISVTATFAINQYTLTYTAGAGGTITGSSPQTVNHGNNGTPLTAVPDIGYSFVQWSDGVLTAARTDTIVTGDISVNAVFAINQYTLTYTAGAGGTITGSSPQTVNHGDNGTPVTAVPDIGYSFVQWSDGSISNPRTDTNVTGNINVTASFVIKQYTLTYTAGAGGTITGSSPQTVNHGDNGTPVTAVPDIGYSFVQWSDGSTSNPRTDTNITGNISVTASFSIHQYTLSYSAGANGSITGTSPQTVNYGDNGTAVTASPLPGYHFIQWSDGVLTAARTDTNITGDISVTATFAVEQYTVTFDSQDAGVPAPGSITVTYGAVYGALPLTSNPGYMFGGWWSGPGGTGSQVTADTVVTATTDHTLYAKWAPPTIAFASDRDGNNEIYTMMEDGSNQTRITNNPASDTEPSWSPDGTRIVFTSNRDGNNEIYVMNPDGSETRLTNNPSNDRQPSWSPDGSRIAFTSNRDGNDEIYVMNPDGSGQTNISNYTGSDSDSSWSPDGAKIAFISQRTHTSWGCSTGSIYSDVYIMNSDGSGQTDISCDNETSFNPSWSPDGVRIAYVRQNVADYQIWTIYYDGTSPTMIQNSAGIDMHPSWSNDNSKIVFHSSRDGNNEIYVMNADGSGAVRLTNNTANDSEPVWSTLPGLSVTSITPGSWPKNSTVSATISGIKFKPGADVRLTKPGLPDIIATGVTVMSETQITCQFNLTGAGTGQWNVKVTNSDTKSGTLASGFTIFSPLVAVGFNRSIITADGITWTNEIIGGMTDFRRIAYGNGVFVAVGQSRYRIRTADGINWTNPFSGSGALMGVAFGNGVFVAVGSTGAIVRSTDNGISWTDHDIGGDSLWRVAYGNGVFVAAGENGRRIQSTDYGITWFNDITEGTNTFYGIAFGNGIFVAVDSGGGRIRSIDYGATWTDQSFGSITHYGLAYGKGLFIAVGDGSRIARSTDDGLTWTEQTLPGAANWLRGIAYGNGMFIAVGDNGSKYISSDGFNWTDVSGGSGLYAIAGGGLGNLLVNPGYETGDATGWVLNPLPLVDTDSVTGSSWGIADLPDPVFDPDPRTGIYSLMASYVWCTKKQTVDIYSYGLTSADLAGTGTTIRFSEFVRRSYVGPTLYYSKITVLDDTMISIAVVENGNQSTPLTINSYPGWEEQTVTFTNTGGLTNIRYIQVESGGKDTKGWSGHYGTQFDDASPHY